MNRCNHVSRQLCRSALACLFLLQACWTQAQATTMGSARILDAGGYDSCAIREDGTMACWGGIGLADAVAPTDRFYAVSSGAEHTCALRANGQLLCWPGETLDGSTTPAGTFVAIAAGRGENCALGADGRLTCWGGAMAAAAPTDAGHVAVSVAQDHGCALRGDGSLNCWQAAGTAGLGPAPSGRFIAVDVGDLHACALGSDGEVVCWGSNAHGQATPPPAASQSIAVAVGERHTCALRAEGLVLCWGDNGMNQTEVPAGRFTGIAAGATHNCARMVDGTVSCWGGDNSYGQTDPPRLLSAAISVGADGDTACTLDNEASRADVGCAGEPGSLRPPALPFTALSLGDSSGCGVLRDGGVRCWGATLGETPPKRFYRIAVGAGHACGIDDDLRLACWGDNGGGQASPPTGRHSEVVSGDRFSCALRAYGNRLDHGIECWGQGPAVDDQPRSGDFLALHASGGNVCAIELQTRRVRCWGEAASAIVPPADAGFTGIAVGDRHACGVIGYASLRCWGDNAQGQLQIPTLGYVGKIGAAGDVTCITTATGLVCWGARSESLPTASHRFGLGSLSAGEHHTCTLRSTGTRACWGDDSRGQLSFADGYVRELDAGGDHTCSIGGDGTLSCWGDDTHGGATPFNGPVRTSETGHFNGCAVRVDGKAECWGWNINGQNTPPPDLFRSVATGLNHSCGVRDDGTLACWGYAADGQIAAPAGAFRQVDVGERHSCAIAEDGRVLCWGLGTEGQTMPTGPSGVQYRAIAAGGFHTCAIRVDGSVGCWGRNDRGQATPPTGTYVAVTAGHAHSCALRDDGVRVCWGDNDSGQAPVPSIAPQTLPLVMVDVEYQIPLRLQSAGGDTPSDIHWAVKSGALPEGMALDPRGLLVGYPQSVGVYAFVIAATEGNGMQAERAYRLWVYATDQTPPVVTPIYEGTMGDNDWYRSDVIVRWSIVDPESPVDTLIGCRGRTVTGDQIHAVMDTCSATSAGGTSRTAYASLKRDATPPSISGVLYPQPNAAGWHNTAVTMVHYCNDVMSGVVSCPPKDTRGGDGDAIFPAHTIRDHAGNLASTPQVVAKIDRTPPVLTITEVGTPNADGWYRDLTQHYTCSDATSGLAESCPAPRAVTETGWSVSAGANVTDNAGNTQSAFRTYKIDRWLPEIQNPGLPNPVMLGSVLQVSPTAADYHSGLASAVCTPIDTASVGRKALTCTATDRVGNKMSKTTYYTVAYDFVPASAPLNGTAAQAHLVQAPRSVPFEWRLRDANGAPVTNATLLASTMTPVACPSTVVTLATPPAGETTAFENFGDGRYRHNWWVNLAAVPDTCQRLEIVLDDGIARSAIVKITPKRLRTGGPNRPGVVPMPPQAAPASRPAQRRPVPLRIRREVQRASAPSGH